MPVTEYIAVIVKPLLTHPEHFSVEQKIDEMGVLLIVRVHENDFGLLIGRGGKTALAVRHLVRMVGMSHKQRVSVKIDEPGKDYNRNKYQNE